MIECAFPRILPISQSVHLPCGGNVVPFDTVDGMNFFSGENQYEYTLDSVHPNDAGFQQMAEGIGAVMRHVLEKEGER